MKRLGLIAVFMLLFIASNSFGQRTKPLIREYLKEHQKELKLSNNDLKNWEITDQHTDKRLGLEYVYINQTHNKIPIFNAMAVFALKDGEIYLTGNDLIENASSLINTDIPVLNAEDALLTAAVNSGITDAKLPELLSKGKHEYIFDSGNISQEEIPVKLTYFQKGEKLLLAWDLNIYLKNSKHWWSIRIDALNGEELERLDWVVECNFGEHHEHNSSNPHPVQESQVMMPPPPPANDTYNVFALPLESPNHGSRSLVIGPYDVTASPYGWHDDNGSPGAEYTITDGNNVYATEDMNDNNGTGYSPDGGALLNFDFTLNMNQAADNYLDPAITNLFYMNNMMHDVWYHYGFDEAAGNFQENNYGNGGSASDKVNADAQDGGGMNNANFSTPSDGQNPRMQMYLWTNPGPDYLTINSPSPIAGGYTSVPAGFGGPIPASPLTSDLVLFDDNVPDAYDACDPAVNAAAMNGKIVVIRRGTCEFGFKVLAAENAGATAVIMVNNVAGAPITMGAGAQGGSVTIPSVMISDVDGAAIIAAIEAGDTVNATLVDQPAYDLDGDFDNGIIAHEYGHGISNRLTGGAGNANCLNNAEQMGEGWSDWFALMMTIEPGDTELDNRGIGTFVTGESPNGIGIRPAPYNTDFAVNNYTYDATNNTGTISEPHGIGFVWCTMLWDMTWDLINQYGFDPDLYNGTGGNNIAMNLVIQGLKLQPCSVGFVDGRDAILQADQMLYGGIHQCLIWNAFANRGLGYSADQGNANSRTDQVEAFDLPPSFVNVSGSESVTACSTYTWSANGNTYTSSGSYTETLLSSTGCDSTATLNLTIVGASNGNETASACDSYNWPTNGQTYSASGQYTATLTNAAGCDSIVTLDLAINSSVASTENISSCAAYTWPANGQTYSSSGNYTAVLTTAAGCDSTVTLNLTMSATASSSMNATACGSYTWSTNGQTYSTSGAYSETLQAASGCDSIVTLNLTINQPTTGSESATSCESYTWSANNQTYTNSGNYTATLTNSAGCDSVVTLNLTILQPSVSTTETVTACDSYNWPADGNNYTSSGNYTVVLTNSAGCDSTVILDLTINQSVQTTQNVTACNDYFWPANGQTYTSAGNYTTTLTAASGCDSVVNLNLTMNTVSTSVSYVDAVSLFADQNFATYNWVDCNNNYAPLGSTTQLFAPGVNGNYAVIVDLNGCVDTSACFVINEVGLNDFTTDGIITVYPNPNEGKFIITTGEVMMSEITLVDNLGRLVAKIDDLDTNMYMFKMDKLATGIYQLHVETNQGIVIHNVSVH